jgi:drug/metabolite transporter (DMT)-like permease
VTDASPPLPGRSPLFGIGLRLGATIAFAIMAALIKLAADRGVNAPELVFYRSAFALPPLMVWIAASGSRDRWRTKRPLAHLTRGLIGLASMFLSFGALTLLPLAEAVTLSFIAPLFAVALSALLLGETVGRYRWTAVAIGLVGVIVVMRPAGAGLSPLGLGLAVAGAFSVGGATITIRQIGRTESTPTTVLWFTGLSTLVLGLLIPFYGEAHAPSEWLILAVMGLTGGIGQLCLTASLRFAPVAVVVPLDYVQLLWVVLLGWLIWSTHPPATTWAGAAVIIGSGLYTIYREHRLGRDKPHRAGLEV